MDVRSRGAALRAALCSVLLACGAEVATPDNAAAPAPPSAATPSAGTTGVTTAPTQSSPGAAALSTPQPSGQTPAGSVSAATGVPAASPDGTAAATSDSLPCEVSTIMRNSCQSCHGATPIGGAPMPLVTFADFHKPANTQPTRKVYELVQERIHDNNRPMPPIGELTALELAAIDNWINAGAATGPGADATCETRPTTSDGAVKQQEHSRGRITPGPNETCYEFKVHGSTTSVDDTKFNIGSGEFYEQFYYEVPWPAGSVATAYATIADNAAVLHHWLLFSTNEAQPHGSHITAPLPTLIGADPILLAGWAVGGPNLVAPQHVGFELPDPGSRTINVQWHFYNSTSAAQMDASSVQICTVPKQMRANIGSVTWLGTEDLNGNVWFGGAGMPPNQESTFTTTCAPGRRGLSADQSIHIIGFEPHMHRIGKRMQTSVKHPDGKLENIFDKPFVFGNETHYYVDHELKPGQQLVTSCTFFNDNDFGVPFGESTDTEMCYQFTFAYPAHALSNGAASLLGVTDTCW